MLPQEIIEPNNQLYCIEENCNEFIQKVTDFPPESKYYGIYPKKTFFLDLNFSSENEFLEKVDKLQNNNWIQANQTRFIGIQIFFMDVQSQQIRQMKISYLTIICNIVILKLINNSI
ncbi:hypothetical protein PPERSA_06834 [Pseudocohnilembus persalinus]|uniref:Uncharacterized protein n=1 Tax=Pseudocohnilembus persalinus TaxID=266149 RepID=A0A0V0QT90_PSEPJ|nr:hypothetical protein PPERSA_06834 [Pseudocohnilembus persalinus]|eukprot:KRX05200.1 hypothetical protein PPERSA_06834 [Pseudocohnilembus persalinus]